MNTGLDLNPEEMRAYGYRVIDQIVNHLATLRTQRVGAKADPARLIEKGPVFTEEPGDFGALLQYLEAEVLQKTMHVNHPRFFAYVPGPSNYISVLADLLASGYNVFAGTWISGSGPAVIEAETVRWIRDICGFPESGGGLFVSGGTMANLTALAVARHARLGEDMAGAVIYLSDQTHWSVEKVLRVLGFAQRQLRKLPSNDAFELDMTALAEAVAADRARGERPFCVVANGGTTNTGAVDRLGAIADFCSREKLWMHVDGAYGAGAAICERGKALLAGMERADSLSIDPHKWLFQPFECGCVLVRDAGLLRAAFQVLSHILTDTQTEAQELNATDYGIQLTRNFRALKLWLSLKTFGVAAFRAAVERGFELAELFESELRQMAGWEVVTPVRMGIVCFRYRAGDDAFHLAMVPKIVADGYALITSTNLRGRTLLRVCPINPRTTDEEVRETLRRLDALARGAK